MKKLTLGVLFSFILLSGFIFDTEPVYGEETLIIGLECNYAPFNWTQLDASNDAVSISNGFGYCGGYDVEIAKKIATNLNKELIIKKITDFDTLPIVLNNGEIDLIIAGMSPTAQRKEVIDFSESYYYSDLVLVARKNTNYATATSLEDFNGAKIAAQIGTMHDDLIEQIPGAIHATPLTDFPTLAVAVKSGDLDAMVAEKAVAMAIVASNPDLGFTTLEDGFSLGGDDQTSLTVAIGMRKNEAKLLQSVNETLRQLSVADRDAMMEAAILNQPAG